MGRCIGVLVAYVPVQVCEYTSVLCVSVFAILGAATPQGACHVPPPRQTTFRLYDLRKTIRARISLYVHFLFHVFNTCKIFTTNKIFHIYYILKHLRCSFIRRQQIGTYVWMRCFTVFFLVLQSVVIIKFYYCLYLRLIVNKSFQ